MRKYDFGSLRPPNMWGRAPEIPRKAKRKKSGVTTVHGIRTPDILFFPRSRHYKGRPWWWTYERTKHVVLRTLSPAVVGKTCNKRVKKAENSATVSHTSRTFCTTFDRLRFDGKALFYATRKLDFLFNRSAYYVLPRITRKREKLKVWRIENKRNVLCCPNIPHGKKRLLFHPKLKCRKTFHQIQIIHNSCERRKLSNVPQKNPSLGSVAANSQSPFPPTRISSSQMSFFILCIAALADWLAVCSSR